MDYYKFKGNDITFLAFNNNCQIKDVGVELYQEMLDEQIAILKNEPHEAGAEFVPIINLGLPILIPSSYITDPSLKLGIYRRIGALQSNEEVENFRDEMLDRFGALPPEFNNLLDIVKIKQISYKLNIENLSQGERGFVLKFSNNNTNIDSIIKLVNKYPNQAKLKPDNKLIFIKKLNQENIINEANELLNSFFK
jgi:transcription-repair coupling factor (superfamily II helicase)